MHIHQLIIKEYNDDYKWRGESTYCFYNTDIAVLRDIIRRYLNEHIADCDMQLQDEPTYKHDIEQHQFYLKNKEHFQCDSKEDWGHVFLHKNAPFEVVNGLWRILSKGEYVPRQFDYEFHSLTIDESGNVLYDGTQSRYPDPYENNYVEGNYVECYERPIDPPESEQDEDEEDENEEED